MPRLEELLDHPLLLVSRDIMPVCTDIRVAGGVVQGNEGLSYVFIEIETLGLEKMCFEALRKQLNANAT